MTARLFTPIEIGGLSFRNRIAVSPMCQYSADDGSATDWHIGHWMSLAMSGAGMVTIEATAVERRGRITHGCLGLYSDDNEAAAQRTLAAARRVAPAGTRFGIQLAHAGRKASNRLPWQGGGPLRPDEDPWQTVGPSAIPFDEGWNVPTPLDEAGIARLVENFVAAAKRAERAGFDFVEIHGAHGYLIHEFLSPLSNKREDRYGGPLENRMRLLLEVARAVRAALPARMMVGARLSASEWTEGGFSVDEAVVAARALKDVGRRLCLRLLRRQLGQGESPADAALPGAFRRKNPPRGRDRDARRRPDRPTGGRRGDRGRGPCRHGGARPRYPRRSALAVARRGDARRSLRDAAAIRPVGSAHDEMGATGASAGARCLGKQHAAIIDGCQRRRLSICDSGTKSRAAHSAECRASASGGV